MLFWASAFFVRSTYRFTRSVARSGRHTSRRCRPAQRHPTPVCRYQRLNRYEYGQLVALIALTVGSFKTASLTDPPWTEVFGTLGGVLVFVDFVWCIYTVLGRWDVPEPAAPPPPAPVVHTAPPPKDDGPNGHRYPHRPYPGEPFDLG